MRALLRLLTFRLDREGYDALGLREGAAGLALALVAGVGRYWDHPTAGVLQRCGVGSVLYVLALAALVWLVLEPFPEHRRRYWNVAAAIAWTSPLAWVYALPVERWVEVDTAVALNLGFLAAVAAWRVALHARYLAVAARCSRGRTALLLLLPLCAIVTALEALNLEHAVFQIMGGIDRTTPAELVADSSYLVVLLASVAAKALIVPLLVLYGIQISRTREPRSAS